MHKPDALPVSDEKTRHIFASTSFRSHSGLVFIKYSGKRVDSDFRVIFANLENQLVRALCENMLYF